MSGWIKIHRKITEWEWYDDVHTKALFIHLLLSVNFEDKNWRGMLVKRGQMITSINTLSDQTPLSVQQVRSSLNKLKSTRELTCETTNKFTLLTIVNWEFYQNEEENVTSKPTHNPTNQQQTNNKQITTTKELKNLRIKEERSIRPSASPSGPNLNGLTSHFDLFWSHYPRKEKKISAKKKYQQVVKQKLATPEELLAGVVAYAKCETVKNGFIKNPDAWLNSGCWQDDYSKPQKIYGDF